MRRGICPRAGRFVFLKHGKSVRAVFFLRPGNFAAPAASGRRRGWHAGPRMGLSPSGMAHTWRMRNALKNRYLIYRRMRRAVADDGKSASETLARVCSKTSAFRSRVKPRLKECAFSPPINARFERPGAPAPLQFAGGCATMKREARQCAETTGFC